LTNVGVVLIVVPPDVIGGHELIEDGSGVVVDHDGCPTAPPVGAYLKRVVSITLP
jgi:hypothetical protein